MNTIPLGTLISYVIDNKVLYGTVCNAHHYGTPEGCVWIRRDGVGLALLNIANDRVVPI